VAIYWLGMAVYRFKYSVFMKTTQLPRKNLKIGFQFFEASNVVIFVCGKSQKASSCHCDFRMKRWWRCWWQLVNDVSTVTDWVWRCLTLCGGDSWPPMPRSFEWWSNVIPQWLSLL